MKKIKIALTCAVAATILLSGCSIQMPRDTGELAQPGLGVVTTKAKAEGIEGKAGWGRFTPFYIPIVPVYVEGDANELVMEQVRKSLRASGNAVAVTTESGTYEGPVVNAKVEQFWFNNYTYFFPLVPTWGNVAILVTVDTKDGAQLWRKTFEGNGFTLNFFNGYTSSSDQSWEKIAAEMTAAFSTPEFKAMFASPVATTAASTTSTK